MRWQHAPHGIAQAADSPIVCQSPERGSPVTQILTYKGAVYPHHCDHMGHMNVASYVAKFDEANWNLFAEIGVTPSYLRHGTCGMAGLQQNIVYRRELFAGDIVQVTSRILEVRDKVVRFLHEMRNGETGDVAAIC